MNLARWACHHGRANPPGEPPVESHLRLGVAGTPAPCGLWRGRPGEPPVESHLRLGGTPSPCGLRLGGTPPPTVRGGLMGPARRRECRGTPRRTRTAPHLILRWGRGWPGSSCSSSKLSIVYERQMIVTLFLNSARSRRVMIAGRSLDSWNWGLLSSEKRFVRDDMRESNYGTNIVCLK